ncbi:MAG: GNAT family N-acetyltransferase [Hyphomicrobiaceae bacterium]|nr:GNAT family N-acetyltransferase [Hyphomicrobiaceae bacterium]
MSAASSAFPHFANAASPMARAMAGSSPIAQEHGEPAANLIDTNDDVTPVAATCTRHSGYAYAAPDISSPGTDVGLAFEVVRSLEALEAIEDEWNELFARAGRSIHVFQTFNWVWHWCRHFIDDRNRGTPAIHIVIARRQGKLILIWPMVRERVHGLMRLSFLGEPVSQYGDLLIDDIADGARVLDRAWTFVCGDAGADTIHLRKVRRDSNIAPLLASVGARTTETLAAPYLDLTSAPDFAAYEKRYSPKARKNRQRQMRRFESRAPASVGIFTGGRRARELSDTAILMKRAWLKDKGLVSTALGDPRTLAFFADAAEANVRPVGCTVIAFETRGEPAAIEVAFDCKGRRVVHILVYALKFMPLGPGQLLVESSIAASYDRGIEVYDLMSPADAYKLDWADASIEVNDWAIGMTAPGRAYVHVYLGFLRARLKTFAISALRKIRALRRG